MYIARWHLTTRFGKTDDCISLLKKWQIDVGERVGWRSASVRALVGVLGTSDSEIQFEARFDSMDDLEAAWKDMRATPYHHEYMKQMEGLIAPGSNRWTVLQVLDLSPKND